jgi:Domain of unknown function (DUF4214)
MIQEIIHMTFEYKKLGKLPFQPDPRIQTLTLGTVSTTPATVDWYSKVQTWPMDMNDRIGDCTIAAASHLIELWTTYGQLSPVNLSEQDVLAAYEAISGYNPANPASDTGCYEPAVLNYWMTNGIGGHKIRGWAAIDYTDENELRSAINVFGGVYLGVLLPKTAQGQAIWDVVPDSGVNGNPGSWGGHAVPVVGWDGTYYYVVTWGELMKVTPAFFAKYLEEAYVAISTDFLDSQGVDPRGLNIDQLIETLEEAQVLFEGFAVGTFKPWQSVAEFNGATATLIGPNIALVSGYSLNIPPPVVPDNFLYKNVQYEVEYVGYIPSQYGLIKLKNSIPTGSGYFGLSSLSSTSGSALVTTASQFNNIASTVKTPYDFTKPTFGNGFSYEFCGSPLWTPSADGAFASVNAIVVYGGNLGSSYIQINDQSIAQIEYWSAQAGQSLVISRLYNSILNRAPELTGWAAWSAEYVKAANQLGGVPSSSQVLTGPGLYIINGFLDSTEAQALNGQQTSQAFVTMLYQWVLGRDPEAAGLQAWCAAIDHGSVSRAQVVAGFVCSPEGIYHSGVWAAKY